MPEIFISPRQGGKTTKAIKWLRANPGAILVVRNQEDVHRLSRQYDLHPRHFVSMGAVRGSERALAGHQGPVGVDAEITLSGLLQEHLGTHLPIGFVAIAEPSATVDAPAFEWATEDLRMQYDYIAEELYGR